MRLMVEVEMKKWLSVFCLFWIALVLGTGLDLHPAWAQEKTEEKTAQTESKEQTEPEIKPMDEVVITATRTETPLQELGVSASIITSKTIEERQAVDIQELLNSEAGLNIVRSGARGGSTSLFTRGGEADYTLVLIDGVRVNNGGGDFDWSNVDTTNVERIEIIRGPQSALYGSDAISGVVNIITKKGRKGWKAGVSSRNGAYLDSQNNYIGEQQVSASGSTSKFGGSFGYTRTDDNGYLDVNHEYYNNTVSGRLDFYPLDNLDIALTGRYWDSRFAFPTEGGGDKVSPLDPDQNQKNQTGVFGANINYEPFSWWQHNLLLSYNKDKGQFSDPPNPPVDFGDFESKFDSREDRTAFDYHFNLLYPSEGAFQSTVTLGVNYRKEYYDTESQSSFDASLSENSYNRDNTALYGQAQFTIIDNFFINLGLRSDDNSEYGSETTPRGSIAYRIPGWGTKFRAGYGEGFKEPTFLEQFAEGFARGNPNLDPERSRSWEIGVDQSFGDGAVVFNVTYFDQKFDNLIAFINTPEPLPSFENIQEAEVKGVEFAARFSPLKNLDLGFSYTYLDSEVTDDGNLMSFGAPVFDEGKELLRRPKNSGSLFINWRYQGFQTRLDTNYIGERDDRQFDDFFNSERVTLDQYWLFNLAMSYAIPIKSNVVKDLKVFGRWNNILGEDYEETAGFTSPPSSFLIGVGFDFGS
jgi:vitamin B12 transporter